MNFSNTDAPFNHAGCALGGIKKLEPRNCKYLLSSRTLTLSLVLITIIVSASAVHASGVVVIRENVAAAKRDELTQKLRLITGWSKLAFDEKGFLQLNEVETHTGSAAARKLLSDSLNSNNVVVIEDASSRGDVAFCRVVPGRWVNGDKSSPAFVILIDFSDFKQLLGDNQARAAFDVGWGFLHELDHVVADSKDAAEEGQLGECEDHINVMRSEVGLPLRVSYFFSESTLKSDPNFGNKLVRLAFEKYDDTKARTRRFWLVWDSTAVGGLSTRQQTAAVQSAH